MNVFFNFRHENIFVVCYKILGACRITIFLRFTILLRHRASIKPSPQHFPRMNQYSEYPLLIKYEHLTPHRLFPPRRTVCELAHQHICTLTNWFISAAITCPGWVRVWHFKILIIGKLLATALIS